MIIRELDAEDKGYALSSWRESHKQAPGCDRTPWGYYKSTWGKMMAGIINAKDTMLLGAYSSDLNSLLGWLAATPGKRVDTLHWVQVKFAGNLRRHGIASALIEAADLGDTFVYTMRGRRERKALPDGTMSHSLDEILVAALGAKGVTATYVALKDWLR